jgi:hypothetical protein
MTAANRLTRSLWNTRPTSSSPRLCPNPLLRSGRSFSYIECDGLYKMAFKRLKGILQFDALRAKDPDLARTYLLDQLLAALIVAELTVRAQVFPHGASPYAERPASLWRMHALWRDALCAAIRGPVTIEAVQGHLPGLARHLHAPLRKRPHQGRLARLRALALPTNEVTAYGGVTPCRGPGQVRPLQDILPRALVVKLSHPHYFTGIGFNRGATCLLEKPSARPCRRIGESGTLSRAGGWRRFSCRLYLRPDGHREVSRQHPMVEG